MTKPEKRVAVAAADASRVFWYPMLHMQTRSAGFPLLALFAACSGKPEAKSPELPAAPSPVAMVVQEKLVTKPEKTPPADLSASEKAQLSGACMPLLTAMIEGEALGMHALDDALRDGIPDADGVGLAVAKTRVKNSTEGLSPSEHAACLMLFEKQEVRKLFEHDPAEADARGAVETCVKRVEAAYGKQSLTFGEDADKAAQGPFCPDDFPVPLKLSQLPYASTKEDWDTPAWRCLQFGLRGTQRVQVEYSAPRSSAEFNCTARYLPRQGGGPVEVARGGKQGPDGRLMLAVKAQKRSVSGPP